MKTALHLIATALVVLSGVGSLAQEATPPNLIWIVTDEHNFRTLGCYRDLMEGEQARQWGDTVVDTPNIDWLADNGALFTSMYAASPVCSPARASMFTGHYPQTVNMPVNNNVMDPAFPTIASVLRDAGYRTGYVGKWHLSGEAKPGWAPQPGYGFDDNRYMFNRGHWKKLGMREDGTPFVAATNKDGEPSYNVAGADETSFTTDWLTDRALGFIDDNRDAPFFCVISIPDPHGPDLVRPPYNELFTDVEFDMPRTFFHARDEHSPVWRKRDKQVDDPARMQNMIAQYFGMVKCIDDNVGRLIADLKADGLLDNTIILFSSDHGDLLGEHNQINKGAPFEGSALIPFIVYHGASVPAGTIVHEAANTTDWMATFLSMAGVAETPPHAGRDLSPLLASPAPDGWDDVTFARINGRWVAAIDQRYKLILDISDADPWLLDTVSDPDEIINHYGEPAYRDAAGRLAQKLGAYLTEQNDPLGSNDAIQTKLKKALAYDVVE